jgi:hypothetical protein
LRYGPRTLSTCCNSPVGRVAISVTFSWAAEMIPPSLNGLTPVPVIMRAREYSPLQDRLSNRKQARYYRIGPWLSACPGGCLSVISRRGSGALFPAPQLQHKLVEPRRHLLSLYPVRYYTLHVAHAGRQFHKFRPARQRASPSRRTSRVALLIFGGGYPIRGGSRECSPWVERSGGGKQQVFLFHLSRKKLAPIVSTICISATVSSDIELSRRSAAGDSIAGATTA